MSTTFEQLKAERAEHETFWWCLKRTVRVVGGWRVAVICPFVVWRGARELQEWIREYHGRNDISWLDDDARKP